MTKKHFEDIAERLNVRYRKLQAQLERSNYAAYDLGARAMFKETVEDVADALSQTNEKFDYKRFYSAVFKKETQ